MSTAGQPGVADALKQLWVKFLPQIRERVAVLERAHQALTRDTLTAEQRADAASAAHKLAGILGTFGLAEGTYLAREAEQVYTGDGDIAPAQAIRLQIITEQLAAMM